MRKTPLFLVIAVILFSGCVASEIEPETPTYNISEESTTVSISSTLNVTPTNISEEATITPPSISTMVATPTLPVLETQPSHLNTLRLCSIPPTAFNYREELGISFITDLRFINEDLLTFEGWAPGQVAISTVAPEDIQPPSTLGSGSFLLSLKAGGLDLTSGNLFTRTLDFAPLLNNPCQEQCTVEIWGQSPDTRWQLIQVSTGIPEEIGVWLVNQGDKIQLVPYVPPGSNWQWATDSSLLWYTFYDREYGVYADAIPLKSPLHINFYDRVENDVMNPLTNIIAFSPQDKTLLSTEQEAGFNELHTIDLTKNPPTVASTQVITDLVALRWNEATQSFLLEIIRKDGLEFREMGGKSLVIPMELLYKLYPSVAKGDVEIQEIAPKEHFAISPSGAHLAIAYKNGEIEIFSCEESSVR